VCIISSVYNIRVQKNCRGHKVAKISAQVGYNTSKDAEAADFHGSTTIKKYVQLSLPSFFKELKPPRDIRKMPLIIPLNVRF